MSGEGERAGGTPRRVTRLQPADCADQPVDGDIVVPDSAAPPEGAECDEDFPDEAEDKQHDRVTAELLAELGQEELEWEFDDEERDDADAAQDRARYLRREQDRLLYARLAAGGFRGSEYEIFRGELAAYALPVMRSWLRRGLVFPYAKQIGRPLTVSDHDRAGLQDVEERVGLAHETVAKALSLFHKRAVSGIGWSPDGGAALTTFFVGTCVAVFPGVFRGWQSSRARWTKAADASEKVVDPAGSHFGDPAEAVVSRQRVVAELQRMPEPTRAIAERIVWGDRSQAEIAEELNLTERAVEGQLYRYRKEHQRRHGEGESQ